LESLLTLSQSDEGVNNYKRLYWDSGNGVARYDLLLFDMIAEVSRLWGFVDTERFSMLGYSGGGQVSIKGLGATTVPLFHQY